MHAQMSACLRNVSMIAPRSSGDVMHESNLIFICMKTSHRDIHAAGEVTYIEYSWIDFEKRHNVHQTHISLDTESLAMFGRSKIVQNNNKDNACHTLTVEDVSQE